MNSCFFFEGRGRGIDHKLESHPQSFAKLGLEAAHLYKRRSQSWSGGGWNLWVTISTQIRIPSGTLTTTPPRKKNPATIRRCQNGPNGFSISGSGYPVPTLPVTHCIDPYISSAPLSYFQGRDPRPGYSRPHTECCILRTGLAQAIRVPVK